MDQTRKASFNSRISWSYLSASDDSSGILLKLSKCFNFLSGAEKGFLQCSDVPAYGKSRTYQFSQLIEQPIDCHIFVVLKIKNIFMTPICWQRCPPVSEVEGTVEAQLRTLGERRRWNVDVLLRLLAQLLTEVQEAAIKSCPFPSELTDTEVSASIFTEDIITLYIRSAVLLFLLDRLLKVVLKVAPHIMIDKTIIVYIILLHILSELQGSLFTSVQSFFETYAVLILNILSPLKE
jgi:hypothetical protein